MRRKNLFVGNRKTEVDATSLIMWKDVCSIYAFCTCMCCLEVAVVSFLKSNSFHPLILFVSMKDLIDAEDVLYSNTVYSRNRL